MIDDEMIAKFNANHRLNNFNKAQKIRLIDIFILGPFMMWSASNMKSKLASKAMLISGVATILYNGRNYFLNEEYTRPNLEKEVNERA